MLDDTQIDKLACDLIDSIDLAAHLKSFEWAKETLQPAWTRRQLLQRDGFGDSVQQYADRVHVWGFDVPVSPRVRLHADFSRSMGTLCEAWSDKVHPSTNEDALSSLAALLAVPDLGIARVTKFVCFLDQQRYAIYDSRVSYALKDLSLDGGWRVFPFVGGRQPKEKNFVYGEAILNSPRKSSTVYLSFLRLLARAAQKLNDKGGISEPDLRQVVGEQWSPALLEMALFMAGKDRLRNPSIRRLQPGFWH